MYDLTTPESAYMHCHAGHSQIRKILRSRRAEVIKITTTSPSLGSDLPEDCVNGLCVTVDALLGLHSVVFQYYGRICYLYMAFSEVFSASRIFDGGEVESRGLDVVSGPQGESLPWTENKRPHLYIIFETFSAGLHPYVITSFEVGSHGLQFSFILVFHF